MEHSIGPLFIISIDVELLWGYVSCPHHKAAKLLANDHTKGRGATSLLLEAFAKYNIPATWAVVGHLFLDHCQKQDGIVHKGIPRFKEGWFSRDPATNLSQDPLYYGKDIVQRIMSSPVKHEICSVMIHGIQLGG